MWGARVFIYVVFAFVNILKTKCEIGLSERKISHAIVPETELLGIVGHSVNISCKSEEDEALRYCRWELIRPPPNIKRYYINITPQGVNGSASSTGNVSNSDYRYVGSGLNHGDCTVSINNLTKFHESKWECLLVSKSNNDTWFGHVHLKSLDTVPMLYIVGREALGDIIYNETSSEASSNVTCCVDTVDPEFTPTLDMHLAKDVRNSSNFLPKHGLNNLQLRNQSVCKTVTQEFVPEDNQKFFVCNAKYIYNSKEYVITNSTLLNIKFAPITNTSNLTLQRYDDKDAVFKIEFTSNPMPNMTWYATTQTETNDSYSYFQIGNNTKYTIKLSHILGDNYLAALKIKNISGNDYKLSFKVELSNQYGSKQVFARIVSPSPGDESDAYWLMILIAIGSTIIFVIVCIVICMLIAKQKSGTYSPTKVFYSKKPEAEGDKY